jgi:hypothetical protein
LGALVIVGGIFSLVNQPEIKLSEAENPKVSPIVLEAEPVVIESPPMTSKAPSIPPTNLALQQALNKLLKVSNSSEISLNSIPMDDDATRSFRLVKSEIVHLFNSPTTQKIKNNKNETIYKNVSLANIKSLTLTATDAKCEEGPLGPEVGWCMKSGRDFSCRVSDLAGNYKNICVSAFSVQ